MRVQLRFGGGGGITIEKIPDLWWLVEHIDIRSRIPVQIVANKAQHMCHTFIHSFTYCTLHVGLLDIYTSFTSHVPHRHLYSSHITCATNSFIHSDRHMCYAYINSCSHITCATHSFIHSFSYTYSFNIYATKYVSHNLVRLHLFQESLVLKTRTHENFKPLKIENNFPFMQYIRVHAYQNSTIYIENTAT